MSGTGQGDDNDRLRRSGRLHDPEDDARTAAPLIGAEAWPAPLAAAAEYGLAGRIVEALDPHTESDRVAVLLQLLAAFGNAAGRGPYFRHESTRHYPCLNVVLVGRSSKARKGTSWQHVRSLLGNADEEWERRRIISGLSSGEGLIAAVKDDAPDSRPARHGTRGGPYDSVVEPGVKDKRLLVIEPEYARVLQAASRDGSTLSAIIREAWDSGHLNVMTKSPVIATNAHISIIGHVTRDELLRYLSRTESANGFANRFLWVCVRRSKFLPEGGTFAAKDGAGFVGELQQALQFSRKLGDSAIERDDQARELWCRVYPDLTADRRGLVGAVLGRAEAQVARLSLVYALLDQSGLIRRTHLEAALAVWEYVERSVAFIFGDSIGSELADRILAELTTAPLGLTRTELRDRLGRNRLSSEISSALKELEDQGLARGTRASERGTGRPVERWFATGSGGYAINAVSAENSYTAGVHASLRVVGPNTNEGR